MKKRLTDWMDDLPMQYLDELEQSEQKLQKRKKTAHAQGFWQKGYRKSCAAAAGCAALLAVILNWEPLAAKANEIFLKSRIYHNAPETFLEGDVKVLNIAIPEDMERISSEVSLIGHGDGRKEDDESWQETGLRKIYSSLEELQKDLNVSVIPEKLSEMVGDELWFTYYDTSREKEAIIDMKLNTKKQAEPVYLEINMLLEEETSDALQNEAFLIDMGGIPFGGGGIQEEKELAGGKIYTFSHPNMPHYQFILEEEENPLYDARILYHRAQKLLTPGYDQEAVFFVNGMRYYLFGIENEEIAEELAEVFLEACQKDF